MNKGKRKRHINGEAVLDIAVLAVFFGLLIFIPMGIGKFASIWLNIEGMFTLWLVGTAVSVILGIIGWLLYLLVQKIFLFIGWIYPEVEE